VNATQATSDWFPWLSRFIHNHAGIVVPASRGYLAETRLTRLLAHTDDGSISALVRRLQRGDSPELITAVVNAFTTNETSFLRDPHVYDLFLTDMLPKIVEQQAAVKRIRIWSAACSTGQEPYSLAMSLMHGRRDLSDWAIEIVASDLSTDALRTAEAGAYRAHEIKRGLPAEWQKSFFTQEGRLWVVKDKVREHVKFVPANLVTGALPAGPFDVVFMRNVLIYFDEPTRHSVFRRIHKQMAPSAPLLLGGAEGATSTPLGTFERHVSKGVHWLRRSQA
jgi:chemotaxis protein methyltransferase CheR